MDIIKSQKEAKDFLIESFTLSKDILYFTVAKTNFMIN
jgi:hypothetical protein